MEGIVPGDERAVPFSFYRPALTNSPDHCMMGRRSSEDPIA
jgi:hypothetical protein